jgi:hypothetical protein
LNDFGYSQGNYYDDLPNDLFGLGPDFWDGTFGVDIPTDNPNTDQFDYTDFDNDIQSGLGPELVPVENEQYGYYSGYLDQTVAPHNDDLGAGLNHMGPPVPAETDNLATFDHSTNYQDQNFDFWDTEFSLPPELTTTPGFSAFPRDTSLMPTTDQNIYPDPSTAIHQPGPYFQSIEQRYGALEQQHPQMYTGYIPKPSEQYHGLEQINSAQQMRSRMSVRQMNNIAVQLMPIRKRTRLDSDSEEDMPKIKRSRQHQPIKQDLSPRSDDSSRHSEVSSSSSLSKPVKSTVIRAGEKPQKRDDKPWVRVNNTTKGETTRTARINQVTVDSLKYKIKKLPHGDWQSTNFTFEYKKNSDMHEFKKRTMSARQIREYIIEYPGNNLRIWIQLQAADSARRYASASHNHCRFEQCPMRQWNGKGTIEVGHYRVAFDEKHKTYGKGVADPYDCVAFAHLYCMERFLDFDEICRVADVRVDERANMPKEPKGAAAFAFNKKHFDEAALANKFLTAARKGRLGDTPEFSAYPNHSDYSKGECKPHENTLVYALYDTNLKHRAFSQMKQFVLYREVRPGSFCVHLGDLEVKLVHKKIESLEAFHDFVKDGAKKDFDYSAYYDYFHPEINQRISKIMKLREQLILEGKTGTVPKRSSKRKAAPVESDSEGEALTPTRTKNRTAITVVDSDDEDDFHLNDHVEGISSGNQQYMDSQRPRCSLRNKQRVDYTEPQDLMPQADIYAQIYGAPPGYAPASTNAQQPQLDTRSPYIDTRKDSCSNLFPRANDKFVGYNIDDLLPLPETEDEPELTQAYIDSILNQGINHRKSSTSNNGPYVSALKSPKMTRSVRTASFNQQPVASSKEFMKNDPPSHIATSPTMSHPQDQQIRRSKRIASKTAPPAEPEKGRASRRCRG